jgi:hypothetical protein
MKRMASRCIWRPTSSSTCLRLCFRPAVEQNLTLSHSAKIQAFYLFFVLISKIDGGGLWHHVPRTPPLASPPRGDRADPQHPSVAAPLTHLLPSRRRPSGLPAAHATRGEGGGGAFSLPPVVANWRGGPCPPWTSLHRRRADARRRHGGHQIRRCSGSIWWWRVVGAWMRVGAVVGTGGGAGGRGRLGVGAGGCGWSVVAGRGLAMVGLRPWLLTAVSSCSRLWPAIEGRGWSAAGRCLRLST